jgi:uncharacterized SAM-dependent methyltransferase
MRATAENGDVGEIPDNIEITEGEHIFLAQSYKYRKAHLESLFKESGLVVINAWSDDQGESSLYLLGTAAQTER